MPSFITQCLNLGQRVPPTLMALSIVTISAISLLAALTAQYEFNLRPCELCLIQRVPFALNIVLGLMAYFWSKGRLPLIGLAGLSFWINSAIAMFHSGVERKWWEGLTGCSTPDMSGTVQELIERIKETAITRCDEIPWSLFGLSMANYNVLLCAGLGFLCFGFLIAHKRLNGSTAQT